MVRDTLAGLALALTALLADSRWVRVHEDSASWAQGSVVHVEACSGMGDGSAAVSKSPFVHVHARRVDRKNATKKKRGSYFIHTLLYCTHTELTLRHSPQTPFAARVVAGQGWDPWCFLLI